MNRRASQKKSPEMHDINVFEPDQVMNVTYRYSLKSAAADPTELITELPIAPFGVSATTSTLYLPFKAVRLKRVRLWCNYRPANDIFENTIGLVLKPRNGARPIQWSDTATPAHTAYISKKFPKSDPVGFWYKTQVNEINPELGFILTKGAVLELSLSYILSDEDAAETDTHTGSLTAGRCYTNRLNDVFRVLGKDDQYCVPMNL